MSRPLSKHLTNTCSEGCPAEKGDILIFFTTENGEATMVYVTLITWVAPDAFYASLIELLVEPPIFIDTSTCYNLKFTTNETEDNRRRSGNTWHGDSRPSL